MSRKHIFWPIIPVLALLPWLNACSEKAVDAKSPAPSIPVILDEVTVGRVESVLMQVGALAARDEVTIRTETAGVVTEILFEEGKDVKKGDVLARLESRKLQSQVDSLQARIEQLVVRLKNQQKELERNQTLLKQNLVAAQQYENLQTQIQETESEVTQAQADLTLQKERLSDSTIKAPFSGSTGARTLSVGDYLAIGAEVVMLVVLDPLDIQFKVPEKFIPTLSLGQTVELLIDAYPGKTFPGTIFFISPQVESISRSVEVKAEVQNPDRLLKPGMFARVRLVTGVREQASLVPTESLILTEDEVFLYTVDDQSVAHKVVVRTGEANADRTEILEPALPAGARVIVEGKYTAKDGKPVAVRASGAPPA